MRRAAGLVMIKPDESAVTVFCVEVGHCRAAEVGMEVDLHAWNCRALPQTPKGFGAGAESLRNWRGFLNFLARISCRVRARRSIPEIEHGLAEIPNDLSAVENGCLPPSRNSRSKK